MTKQDLEDARKLDEEKRLLSISSGKSPASVGTTTKKTISPRKWIVFKMKPKIVLNIVLFIIYFE